MPHSRRKRKRDDTADRRARAPPLHGPARPRVHRRRSRRILCRARRDRRRAARAPMERPAGAGCRTAAPVETRCRRAAQGRWTHAHVPAGSFVRRPHGAPPAHLFRRRRHDAGAGDRRQHRHLQLRERPPAASPAVEGHADARLDLRRRSAHGRRPRSAVDPRIPRLPQDAHVVRIARGLVPRQRDADRPRRRPAAHELARIGQPH